jgi:hypothetical protein
VDAAHECVWHYHTLSLVRVSRDGDLQVDAAAESRSETRQFIACYWEGRPRPILNGSGTGRPFSRRSSTRWRGCLGIGVQVQRLFGVAEVVVRSLQRVAKGPGHREELGLAMDQSPLRRQPERLQHRQVPGQQLRDPAAERGGIDVADPGAFERPGESEDLVDQLCARLGADPPPSGSWPAPLALGHCRTSPTPFSRWTLQGGEAVFRRTGVPTSPTSCRLGRIRGSCKNAMSAVHSCPRAFDPRPLLEAMLGRLDPTETRAPRSRAPRSIPTP